MRQFQSYIFLAALLLISVPSGCDRMIYDDLSECPQGVNFAFYTQTPCESGPSYPKAIKQVHVFAFDENEVLAEEYAATDVALSADYLLKTPFYKVGKFTFVAWGGEDLSTYDFSQFTKGTTTKQQMFLSMKKQAGKVSTHPLPLYYGASPEPLVITDRTDLGSIFDLVSFNMQEFTNRIRFTIHGLSKEDAHSVVITDDNGNYDFNADYAPDTRFDYTSPVHRDGDMLKADFTVMKLAEGRDTRFTLTNTTTGKVIYSADLVDDIIMYRGDSGEPPYRLECDHDFNIIIVFEPNPESQTTYMLTSIIVNDWNVVKRPVILG